METGTKREEIMNYYTLTDDNHDEHEGSGYDMKEAVEKYADHRFGNVTVEDTGAETIYRIMSTDRCCLDTVKVGERK